MIKNNAKKYRIWKNFTQEGVAKDLKISIHQLRSIETKDKYPKYQVRKRICDYFGVTQDQMFYKE